MTSKTIELGGFPYELKSEFTLAESMKLMYELRKISKREIYIGMQATLEDNGLGYQAVYTNIADKWMMLNWMDCPPLLEFLCSTFLSTSDDKAPSPFEAIVNNGEEGMKMLEGFFTDSLKNNKLTNQKPVSSEQSENGLGEQTSAGSPQAATN